MLTSILLRLVARSSDALVAFVTGLDAVIDRHLAQLDDEFSAFEQKIIDIKDDAEAIIDDIRAEADDAVKAVEDTIAEKKKAAKVLLGLKGTLPTGE